MKKLIVKAEFIATPYSPSIPGIAGVEAQPEKWIKGEEVVFEAPQDLTDWVYHPAVEGVEAVAEIPEVLEVKEWRVIAQTQGTDDQLAEWLAGDSFKYPEGYQVEYIDISAQIEQERINAESLAYLASTDWMEIRFTETGAGMPADVKATRQLMRDRIVK
jgi:hypothetical protein